MLTTLSNIDDLYNNSMTSGKLQHQEVSTTTGATTSASSSCRTNSSSNTNNSLSHNNPLNTFKLEVDDDAFIPNGYSVHIKASNKGNSETVTNSSTSSINASMYNPSLPNLTSSESLSAFSIFDGLTTFPIMNGPSPNSSITGSSLTNALFNTNPLPTVETMTPNTNIVTDETVAQIVSNNSVPEFLYQLTKMLTDDHRDIIEWSNGKIEVHNPIKLEKEVLNQYFRHSKYASFQRQLNYFGFRKLAGKGKMAPCSYINENATSDLKSLLRMKVRTFCASISTMNLKLLITHTIPSPIIFLEENKRNH
jgi:hypothetical protein